MKKTYEEVKKVFESRGYILLDTEYINNRTKMRYLCPIHGEQEISYDCLRAGHRCQECNKLTLSKRFRHSYEFIKCKFEERGYTLVDGQEYINAHQKLKYICPIHGVQEIDFHHLKTGNGCKKCGSDRTAEMQRGSKSHFWNGGITELNHYIRERVVLPWKLDSMKQCEWKCVLSGSKNWHVHHLKGFNMIVKETLDALNLSVLPSIGSYTEEQLEDIKNKCLELHYEHLGVCLDKTLHALFHSLYGNGDNTPEQFEEFTKRYKDGEFTEQLSI